MKLLTRRSEREFCENTGCQKLKILDCKFTVKFFLRYRTEATFSLTLKLFYVIYFQLYIFKYDHSYKLGLVGSVGDDKRESCKTKADRVKKSTSKCWGTAR